MHERGFKRENEDITEEVKNQRGEDGSREVGEKAIDTACGKVKWGVARQLRDTVGQVDQNKEEGRDGDGWCRA